MKELASALTGLHGERVALCDVAVTAVLQDLLGEVTVAQTYRNDEDCNIEAVYTFPLPLDAVLLDLEVELGERRLKGTVVEKKAAEKRYEGAITAGDAAVMLEVIEPGLYTMNVGNLLPGETAKITFRYAILYRWTGDRLRVGLPTTIAPRYGRSRHQPHQEPEASLTVENRFSLRVEVHGALRDAQFSSPSHEVGLEKSGEVAVLSLVEARAVMDRDFVLNIRAPQSARSFVLCGQDGEGAAALASFQPFFPGLHAPLPLSLAIVIDCSGSMAGDSIEQAKQALDSILESLQPQDRIGLVAFGTEPVALSERLLACNKTNLGKARRFAQGLEANLGGTEIGTALQKAYAVLGRAEASDIFLVTDGEVAGWEEVVREATSSGHRVFTVGVGSAVSEAFVRALAESTGGSCELVSPREGMAQRVVRHFDRMRAPRARSVTVQWPEGASNATPASIGAVFEGDTVVACARFPQGPQAGTVVLQVETEDGSTLRQELPLAADLAGSIDGLSTVSRVAGALRMKELDAPAGLECALRYRLISPYTNWLVVAERAEGAQAIDLPELRMVPQTLAAGWGGVGRGMPSAFDAMAASAAFPMSILREQVVESFDLSASMPRSLRGARREAPSVERLVHLVEADVARLDVAGAQDLLMDAGLAASFEELLLHAGAVGIDVRLVAAMIVAGLLKGATAANMSSEARAALAALQAQTRELVAALRELARQAEAMAQIAESAAVRGALRLQAAEEETLVRIVQRAELLDRIDEEVRRTRVLALSSSPTA